MHTTNQPLQQSPQLNGNCDISGFIRVHPELIFPLTQCFSQVNNLVEQNFLKELKSAEHARSRHGKRCTTEPQNGTETLCLICLRGKQKTKQQEVALIEHASIQAQTGKGNKTYCRSWALRRFGSDHQ